MKNSFLLIIAMLSSLFVFTSSMTMDKDPVREFMKQNAANPIDIEVIEFERDWVEYNDWGIRIGEMPEDVPTSDDYLKNKRMNAENSMTLKLTYEDMLSKIFSIDICSMQTSASRLLFSSAKINGWVYVNIWIGGEKKSKTYQEICSRVINGYNMKGMEAISSENTTIENGSLIYKPDDAPSGLKKIKLRLTPNK